MEIFLHPIGLSQEVTIFMATIILILAILVLLFFFVFRPIRRRIYYRRDHKGDFVYTDGWVIEKRFDADPHIVVVMVDNLVTSIYLPEDAYRTVEAGEKIDLRVKYGKLSKRILAVQPVLPKIDTFA